MRSGFSTFNAFNLSGSTLFAPFLFFLFLIPFSSVCFSQSWVMPVDGKVYAGKDKLTGSIVTLFRNGQQMQQVITTSNGKFSFELLPNAEYIVAVTKPGFITKKFKIVTANVPADRADAGNFNPFEPDVTLFEMPSAPEVAKRVEAILSQPIAVYQYIPTENNFNYDDKYTQAIQQKLAELADLQKQAEKEMQDKAKNAALEAQKQLETDNKYKAAIAKGDKALAAADYPTAKAGYNEALGVKPAEAYPKQKLAEIDKLMANAGAQKALDDKYKAAIAKADGAFGTKDYAGAKSAYTEASGVKPAEAYPKQKIAEIDKLLAEAGKQKELDEKYRAAVAKADGAFGTKDYAGAKSAYTEASGIKPAEAYPKQKIAEIDRMLAEAGKQKEIDVKYQAAVTKGDKAFTAKDYSNAKAAFTEAGGIKPAEAYPKNKIAEIDKLLAGLEADKLREQQYKDAIAKGDAGFGSKDYAGAKSAFTQASALKPAEQYPKTKIAEIDKILGEMAKAGQLDKQYSDLIAKGDNLFTQKNYPSAKSAYSDASSLKPAEAYPKQKIAEIDKLLADLDAQKSAASKQKEIDGNYNAAIQKADAAFAAKDYAGAKDSYILASGIKQNEQYPKQKINEINKLLADLSARKSSDDKDKQYKEAIAKGDKLFGTKFYEDAKAAYTGAVGIKPTEEYPRSKLAEIDKILKDLAAKQSASDALDNNYKTAISRGDVAFNGKNFANAKVSYNEALTYKPGEKYPTDKLAEIEKLENDRMAASEQKDTDVKYKAAIDKADKAFSAKDYPRAKSGYEEALFYKPLEKHPKDRLKMITDMIKNAQLAQAVKKETKPVTPVVAEEEKKKQYQSELRSKYPAGVTEEEFTEGSKTILKRVVIKEDYAGVYTKVTHNWGGIYCFKDGHPITEIMFDNESR